MPDQFGDRSRIAPIILRAVQLIAFPMLLHRVGIHQVVGHPFGLQLLGQELPQVICRFHPDLDLHRPLTLTQLLQTPFRVRIPLPFLPEGKPIHDLPGRIEHYHHILLQCQINAGIQPLSWLLSPDFVYVRV